VLKKELYRWRGWGHKADCCVVSTFESTAGGAMGCVSGVGVGISEGLVAL